MPAGVPPVNITVPEVRIVLCVLLPIACLVTYFRLYIRYTRGKLWWDDFWAFICTLCAIVFVAAAMLHVQSPGQIPHNAEISIYYMCAQFFYAVVWTARISIMFTVIRLSFGQMRRLLFGIVIAFFVAWLILFSQVWWVCENQPGWKDLLVPQCALGEDVAIAQLTTDVLCDVILIAAPMRLLWRVQLDRGLKLRLRAVFATTAIGTAVSLYHAYCVLKFGGLLEFLAATVQLATNLIVVNLPVIVAVVFRLKTDSESDNVAPLSGIVTIGSARNRRNGRSGQTTTFGTTTLGGSEVGTKLNVHIVQTNSQWGDTTKVGGDDYGKDTVELKSMSNDAAFAA